MRLTLVLVPCLLALVCVESKDLILGTNYGSRLIWQHYVVYNCIPYKNMVKEEYFSDPGEQIIRAIFARDMDQTDATVTITAGGIGFSYVNLRFKSAKGHGLHYEVEVYA